MPRQNFLCANPNCGMSLIDLKSTTPLGQPEVDDMIVCGACRVPSVITLLGTRLFNEDELSKAPPEVRADLAFAIRALDAKLKQN